MNGVIGVWKVAVICCILLLTALQSESFLRNSLFSFLSFWIYSLFCVMLKEALS